VCRIWEQLKNAHARNAQVQARLFATYRREYENLTHLPGESIDAMFQRFMVIVNNMRANVVVLPYDDHDEAMKLLHYLDRIVWSGKVEDILQSEKYETLTVDELFSKLKSSEVDRGVRAKIENSTDPHSLALVSGSRTNSNMSSRHFPFSCLVSMPDEEFNMLGEEDLTLLTRQFECMYTNRKNSRRSSGMCYRCAKHEHLITECPEAMEVKLEHKHRPKTDHKHRSRDNYKGKNKSERRPRRSGGHKKKERAMVAGASDIDSSSCYSSSSSSDEEENRHKGKQSGKNINGLCFASQGFCGMAHSSTSKKSNKDDSGSDTEEEVNNDPSFLIAENARLNDLLDNCDDVLRKTNKEKREYRSLLGEAKEKVVELESLLDDARVQIDSDTGKVPDLSVSGDNFDLVGGDPHDPTTTSETRSANAITKPTPDGYQSCWRKISLIMKINSCAQSKNEQESEASNLNITQRWSSESQRTTRICACSGVAKARCKTKLEL
jgi:hypothetical protein